MVLLIYLKEIMLDGKIEKRAVTTGGPPVSRRSRNRRTETVSGECFNVQSSPSF
jgi:hypothetical protein